MVGLMGLKSSLKVYVTGFPDTPVAVEDLPGQEVVRPDVVNRLTETMKLVHK